MKKVLFIAIVLFFTSCGNEKNNEDIQQQISDYKKEVAEINNKIKALEEELDAQSDAPQKSVPVSVLEMKAETFNHYIEVNGTVEAVNSAFISPEINGQVEEIFVGEGDRVSTGQKLFKLNSVIIENSIKEIKTSLVLATTVYEKQKRLYDKEIGSEIDYLTAKNNKESLESKLETLRSQLDMAKVKAPFDGIIDDILIEVGEMAMPGMMTMQLVNLDNLYVNADVSEALITKIKKGDKVMLEFPSYPEFKMEVPVFRTGNVVKSANRTFKVQLKIKNQNETIKPNVIALIKINDFTSEEAFSVPSIIIKEDLKGLYVYVTSHESNTSASKVYVKTGKSYGSKTMITDGLKAGDKVIVKGYNLVSDGMKINIQE